MNEAGREIIWLRGLLTDLGEKLVDEPTKLFIDNQTAIRMAEDSNGNHNRRKHINVRYHWIRDQIEAGVILPQWIRSEAQEADIMTKPLGKIPFIRCRDLLMGQASEEDQNNSDQRR